MDTRPDSKPLRGGGAQLPAPARGWTWGLTEYYNRLNATLSHYHTVRQYDGNFIFQFRNLWGADGAENSSMPYPGDNGDWSYYYEFLAQVIRDLKAHHALEVLSFEPWNEADRSWAWKRPMSQFMEMFVRSVQYVRDEVPGVPVIGPTFYGPPKRSSTWWTTFMQTVATNSCIPDQWTWHMLSHEENMLSSNDELEALLRTYNLPRRQLNIDEYSPFAEQVPAGSAWWISQFERMDAIALRSNWLDGSELWDFLASLLWKPNPTDATSRGYWPNGDYQVYKYYGSDMRSGYRVGTIPSGDMNLDTFDVVGDDGVVRVLAGVHNVVGMWHVACRIARFIEAWTASFRQPGRPYIELPIQRWQQCCPPS